MSSATRPKKQVSERRRMQNKQAQKNYRERQKKNLEVLQDIARSRPSFFLDRVNKDARYMESGMDICTNASPELDSVYDASDASLNYSHSPAFLETESIETSFGRIGQSRDSFLGTNQQPQSFPLTKLPLTPESSQEQSIISHLLVQEGVDLDERAKLQILEKKINLQGILKAGLKALLQDTSSEALCSTSHENREKCATNHTQLRTDKILVLQNANNRYAASLPDIRRNHFRIKQVLFTAACVINAKSLGVTLRSDDCIDLDSPFFRDAVSESDAKTACMSEFADINTHLRPCATQLMHQHHPYIDVLPFPTFRERIIKLAYVEEPMIDEDDLCKDLENDGLVCWGSALGGGSAATGSGAPWDIRSWEAQPWFLKKWWILIGGVEGEIYKQTQWWCEMRGERSCYPW